jgi:signal transduction histidine kinase
MIVSQLLLTIFVLQWLRSQYNNERQRMKAELTATYLNTQDELVDTLLFKSYVKPVIAHKTGRPVMNIISVSDSLPHDTIVFSGAISTGTGPKWETSKTALAVEIGKDTGSAAILTDSIKIRKTNNEMLLRSVRLIVSHTTDSGSSGNPKLMRFDLKLDSTVFTRSFGDKISGKGMKFSIAWYKNIPESDTLKNKCKVFINPENPFLLPEAAVSKYSGYLLNRILPQIIFGILLVFITALAFFLSYRSIREQRIMNSLRNEFISNITHELRTPVATISVALESLGKFNMRSEPSITEQYLKLANVETKRLEELVNRVLEQTVLEENNSGAEFIQTDINLLIKEAADIMNTRLPEEGSINIEVLSEKLISRCDPLFLKGALINLIENSIRYCDKVPQVIIQSYTEGGNIVISVNDNGPGIPSEYHNKIFEKFFRLPSGNIHNVKGYGLGLSFVKQVMNIHNGTVRVRNLNQGCSFILKFPVA